MLGESFHREQMEDRRWFPNHDIRVKLATRESQGRILSPPSPAFRTATVSALIDPQTNTWNDNHVDRIFLPFEAQKIKAIPLCITDQPDCLFWPKSNDGAYMVSSGYQWLCSEENSGAVSVSNTERCRNFWKKNLDSKCAGKDKNNFCGKPVPTFCQHW